MSKHYLHKANVLQKGTVAHEAAGEVIDLAVGAAASFGFGYLTGKYREKTLLFGGRVPLDFGVGMLLSVGSVALEVAGVGDGLSGLAKDIGHAGVNAWAHTHGVGAGTKASGVERVLVQKKDLPKLRAAVPSSVVLGSTGQAPHGKFLSPERLTQLSQA